MSKPSELPRLFTQQRDNPLPIYESLLDLATKTTAELAELKPRNRIDVQSFIWVVGDYREGRASSRCRDANRLGAVLAQVVQRR